MARTGAYTYTDDEIEGLNGGQWASGIGTGAASGAMAGSAAGPWGTVIGGVLGGVAGAVGTGEQDAQYREAQKQQQALDRELTDRSYIDGLMMDANIARTGRERAAFAESEFAANRLGLTGTGAAQMQESTRHNLAVEDASTRGDLYRMANEMEAQRQGRVMDKYKFQQGLAENAMANSGQTLQALGTAAGSIGKLATMTQETPAAAAASTGTTDDLMSLGGEGGSTYEPGMGLSPDVSDRMRAISYQAKATPQMQESMRKLSPAEQVGVAEQYPEAFGGKYSFPEQTPSEYVPTSWEPPVEAAMAAAAPTAPAPSTGAGRPGKATGRAATAPPAGGGVVTAPRTGASQGASQGSYGTSPSESRPSLMGFSPVEQDLYPNDFSDVSDETGVSPTFGLRASKEGLEAEKNGDYDALLNQGEEKLKLTEFGQKVANLPVDGIFSDVTIGEAASSAFDSVPGATRPIRDRIKITEPLTPQMVVPPTPRNGGMDKEYQAYISSTGRKPTSEQEAIRLYSWWLSNMAVK